MDTFNRQSTRRFHALCGICYGKENGDIFLLDNGGNHLGVVTKARAENLAVQKDLCIGLVDNSSEVPTYQLMSREQFSKLNKHAIEEDKELKKKTKRKQPKKLTLKTTIDQHALEIKLKSVDKWIDQGKNVTIFINKPRNSEKVSVLGFHSTWKAIEHDSITGKPGRILDFFK